MPLISCLEDKTTNRNRTWLSISFVWEKKEKGEKEKKWLWCLKWPKREGVEPRGEEDSFSGDTRAASGLSIQVSKVKGTACASNKGWKRMTGKRGKCIWRSCLFSKPDFGSLASFLFSKRAQVRFYGLIRIFLWLTLMACLPVSPSLPRFFLSFFLS